MTHLEEYLLEQSGRPFEWGRFDCVQLAAGWIRRSTGNDPTSGYSYSTEVEAKSLIERAGGLLALATDAIGEPLTVERYGKEMQAGDIALTAFRDTGQILGLVSPPKLFVPSLAGGLRTCGLELAIYFWKVRCPE